MEPPAKTNRLHSRAERLRNEALNCLGLAVNERDGEHRALLIDEAVRLTRRARELSAG